MRALLLCLVALVLGLPLGQARMHLGSVALRAPGPYVRPLDGKRRGALGLRCAARRAARTFATPPIPFLAWGCATTPLRCGPQSPPHIPPVVADCRRFHARTASGNCQRAAGDGGAGGAVRAAESAAGSTDRCGAPRPLAFKINKCSRAPTPCCFAVLAFHLISTVSNVYCVIVSMETTSTNLTPSLLLLPQLQANSNSVAAEAAESAAGPAVAEEPGWKPWPFHRQDLLLPAGCDFAALPPLPCLGAYGLVSASCCTWNL